MRDERLLPTSELTATPPTCAKQEETLLPTRELIVMSPACAVSEETLLPTKELTVMPPAWADKEETLLPIKVPTVSPPICAVREERLLPTKELTVARVPVKTPVCDAREETLLPTNELVCTVKVDTEVAGGGVKEVAVSVPTFRVKEEMAPPVKVFAVIETVERGAIILTVLVKITSFTKETGENPSMEDTVNVLVITEPVDIVRDIIELVVVWFAVKTPVWREREETLLPTKELTVVLVPVKTPVCVVKDEVVGRRRGTDDL